MGIVLAVSALAASIVLLLQHKKNKRIYPIVAAVVSGLEVAAALGLFQLHLGSLPLVVIFGAALAVIGAILYMQTSSKTAVTAASILAFVGALQVLGSLGIG